MSYQPVVQCLRETPFDIIHTVHIAVNIPLPSHNLSYFLRQANERQEERPHGGHCVDGKEQGRCRRDHGREGHY